MQVSAATRACCTYLHTNGRDGATPKELERFRSAHRAGSGIGKQEKPRNALSRMRSHCPPPANPRAASLTSLTSEESQRVVPGGFDAGS